jgi:hypothetical protein
VELLLLVLKYNQPANFAGTVPSTIIAFHHYLKYEDLIDLLHNFRLLRKTAPPGF